MTQKGFFWILEKPKEEKVKIKKIRFFKFLGLSLLVVLLGISGSLQAMDLPKTIDKTNCS